MEIRMPTTTLIATQDTRELHVVTGAFGFTGKHIAEALLMMGKRVRTLTGHPDSPSSLRGMVEIAPYDFEYPERMMESLRGAKVLYNTYWIRFPWGGADHTTAVENSKLLIQAAEEAGVERIVHVSVTNPSLQSRLPYFHGKALVEEFVRGSRMSHAILRPAVLFGEEDILINNIAWMLRRFPVFAVPGRGDYRLQPIYVGDFADLAVECGASRENLVRDAVGPDTYPYVDLVRMVRDLVGSRSRLVFARKWAVMAASWMLGHIVNDVVLTEHELNGLMSGLLVSSEKPVGSTRLHDWLRSHSTSIGTQYVSELDRHYRRAEVAA
jgi:NADH dehydrogenase